MKKVSKSHYWLIPVALLLSFIVNIAYSYALSPDEVLIIYNKKEITAPQIASTYAHMRHIPDKNILAINTLTDEVITRKAYLESIVIPIRAYLSQQGRKNSIKCFALIYGIPLRIKEIDISDTIAPIRKLYPKIDHLKEKAKDYKRKLKRKGFLSSIVKLKQWLISKLKKKREKKPKKGKKITLTTVASVDSELSLVLWDNYTFGGWMPNPLFYRYTDKIMSTIPTYMVARLDGPTPHDVLSMIKRTLEAEAIGLQGKAYFDTRGLNTQGASAPNAYARYDQRIAECAKFIANKTALETIIDSNATLFQENACPDTAIYCGWYQLGEYIDSFSFSPGAIGYHIASAEATSLRFGNYWCKKMIENNITATFGPVAEPYLASFPDPVLFFSYLLSGEYTLVEAFFRAKPFASWMMTLIGDPLYRPRLQ